MLTSSRLLAASLTFVTLLGTAAWAQQPPPPSTIDAGTTAQIFELKVRGGAGTQPALEPLPVPEQYRWSQQELGPANNVAEAYARFARDYREGTHFCPTFDDAVTRHRMLDAIETAATTGQRQTLH